MACFGYESKPTKEKFNKPILSEDQVATLNRIMIEKYSSNSEVELICYSNGSFYKVRGFITKLDKVGKRIQIKGKFVHISQIVNIK